MAKAKKTKGVGKKRKAKLKALTTKEDALRVLGGILVDSRLTLRECTVLRQCCDARIKDLAAPREWRPATQADVAPIEEVKDLFKKLTGHPLDEGG